MAIRVRRLARRGFIGGLAVFSAGFAAPLPELEADQSGARAAIAGLGAGAVPPLERLNPRLPPASLTAADRGEWMMFQRRFVSGDGRVIDTRNGGVSHSEGQGWGLLFAESFDDPEAFDRILGWTANNLRKRGDALHAWRYQPGQANPVSDINNATDGDLFIAAALARAALRWGRPDLAQVAGAIGRDVLALLVRDVDGRLVLLPGERGFEKRDAIVVNPSYYAFGVLPYLEAVAPSPVWQQLRVDGLNLIQQGRFGPWSLPPDWLLVPRRGGMLSPAPSWPARFSYDAIRVPPPSGLGGAAHTGCASCLPELLGCNSGLGPSLDRPQNRGHGELSGPCRHGGGIKIVNDSTRFGVAFRLPLGQNGLGLLFRGADRAITSGVEGKSRRIVTLN